MERNKFSRHAGRGIFAGSKNPVREGKNAKAYKQKEKNIYQNRKNCSKKEKQQVEKTKERQSKAEKSENSYEPYVARDHSSDRVDHNKSGQ